MNEREKLTHACCPLCGVGGAEPSSHTPEEDNVSTKAWRQVLLSWLLCQRVQSSQVRAELLQFPVWSLLQVREGVFFPPHCLNLEWAQMRPVEPTNVVWHYWSRTELVLSYLFL